MNPTRSPEAVYPLAMDPLTRRSGSRFRRHCSAEQMR